jgi:hypothetical protein
MKSKLFFAMLLMSFVFSANAQAIGNKKILLLKISAFQIGEESSILEMKDQTTNKKYYIFDMMDDKTEDNGIIEEIRNIYYKSGENDNKLKGKIFQVSLEYRTIDEIEYFSPEEPPRKTGKKHNKWMINSISKIIKK